MIQFSINLNSYPELEKLKKVNLNKKIAEIFNLGYKLTYPKLDDISSENNLIISKLNDLEKHTPTINELNKSITQLLGITSNSSKKGEFVEGILEEYIINKYSSGVYQVKRNQAHCGDGWLTLNNKKTVMVEVKAYSKTVNETEVEKLRYDMKFNNINLGIMVSLGSQIQNSKTIDLELFNYNNKSYYIVKIGPVLNNRDILEMGFSLIEKISLIIDNNLSKVLLEDNLLEKTTLLLEKINSNYKLRESYQNMSMDIYQKMDSFNQEMLKLFMEQEHLIKQIVYEIGENSIHTLNIKKSKLEDLNIYQDNKIYSQLIKVVDFLENKKISWQLIKDKIIGTNIEIKITKEKITINLLNITLIFTSKLSDVKMNQQNLKLLKQLYN